MRQFLLYLLILTNIPAIAQNYTTTKITLTADSTRPSYVSLIAADTIRFYKLPEDTLAFTVLPLTPSKRFAELYNMPVATYRVVYKNIFRQYMTRQITLAEKTLNEVFLSVDSVDCYSQHTLARLQDKESVIINFRTQGCFHSGSSDIVITRKDGQFVAQMYRLLTRYSLDKSKQPVRHDVRVLQSVTLTNRQIEDFTRFENELLHVSDGGCTTTDWYEIKCKYFNVKMTDGGCLWSGFYYIRSCLFGRQE